MLPGIGINCWSERGMPCWRKDTRRPRRDSSNAGRNNFPILETPRRACSVEAVIFCTRSPSIRRVLHFPPPPRSGGGGNGGGGWGGVVQNQGLYRASSAGAEGRAAQSLPAEIGKLFRPPLLRVLDAGLCAVPRQTASAGNGVPEVRAFLANGRFSGPAAAQRVEATAAIRFLYEVVLQRHWPRGALEGSGGRKGDRRAFREIIARLGSFLVGAVLGVLIPVRVVSPFGGPKPRLRRGGPGPHSVEWHPPPPPFAVR